MNEEKMIELINKQSAAEDLDWVKTNPYTACGLIWYLMGYAGLASRFEPTISQQ